MKAAVAVRAKAQIARSLSELVPLIQEEIAAGTIAGLEHYRRAGELLLEVRDSGQVAEFKWGKWLRENFALSRHTAYDYITLAERIRENPDLVRTSSHSMFEIIRPAEHEKRKARRAAFQLHRAVLRTGVADQELEGLRQLQRRIVEVGYKALAHEYHPDKGGTSDAMAKLTKARDALKRRIR